MKQFKNILLFLMVMTSFTRLVASDSWFRTFYTTVLQPRAVLCITSLAALGTYMWHMAPEERIYTYSWLQQTYLSVPQMAWYSLLAGSLCTYCLLSNKTPYKPLNPLDNNELKSYIDRYALRLKNLESILDVKTPDRAIGEEKDVVQESAVSRFPTELNELRNRITVLEDQAELQGGQLSKLEEEVFPNNQVKPLSDH